MCGTSAVSPAEAGAEGCPHLVSHYTMRVDELPLHKRKRRGVEVTGHRAGEFPNATLVGERRELRASSVVELISRWADTAPDAVALECGSTRTTFRQLWRRSMSIAAGLRDMEVQPGEVIGVIAHRNAESVAAMIAVMAVRAAYAPIDPTNPLGRVRLILDQVRPRTMLWDGGGSVECAA